MAIPSDVDDTWAGTSGVTTAEFETITGAINTLLAHIRTYGTATLLNASAPAASLPASPVAGQIAFVTGGATPTADTTLTGTWPNLTIGTGKVTTAMIADGAITPAKLDGFAAALYSRVTADQTLTAATSATAVNITDLIFDGDDLPASSVWDVSGMIMYQAVTAGDLQFIWSLPSGATIVGTNGGPAKGAGSPTASQTNWANVGGTDADRYVVGGHGAGASNTGVILPRFLLTISSTVGDCQLTGKQYTTDATKPVILAGSFLRAERIA